MTKTIMIYNFNNYMLIAFNYVNFLG